MAKKKLNFAYMKGLSVLIPLYKDYCVEQVTALQRQCEGIAGLAWEIVVAYDGARDSFADANAPINCMDGCRLIVRGKNCGRSATRNFLAHEARYDTLIYIDSGLKPNPHFVEKYVENMGRASVVCGNIEVDRDSIDTSNLRCKNELRAQYRFTADRHATDPYKNFHSGNFMAERGVMTDNPFREDITTYGYEDTLFGKRLAERRVSILHIDNPVLFVRFESNARFLEKTKEGIATLFAYRDELVGYSPLLRLACTINKWHLSWLLLAAYRCLGRAMETNLRGRHPSLAVFSFYRSCLLTCLLCRPPRRHC